MIQICSGSSVDHFFAPDFDGGICFQRARDLGGEQVAIDGQGVPGGHPRSRRDLID